MKKLLIILLCFFSLKAKSQQVMYPEDRKVSGLACGLTSAITYTIVYGALADKHPKQASWIGAGAGMLTNIVMSAVVYSLSDGNSLNKRQNMVTGFCTGVVTVGIIRIGIR